MIECVFVKTKGVITVLISLMLVGVLSIGTLVIESGRYQAAKTQLAQANISASTSMIAAYDADLYERYGLLAIDTERFTPQRATDYLNFNADQATGYRGNRLSRLYAVDSVELTGLYNLTYPSVLKRQMLSRAKYHVIPQNYALNVETMHSFLSDFQSKCQYVAQKLAPVANGFASTGSLSDVPQPMRNALKALYATYKTTKQYDEGCNVTLNGATTALLPSVTGTVENNAPSEDVADIDTALSDATTVLGGSGAALSYNNGTPANEIDVSISVSFVSEIKEKMKDLSPAGVSGQAKELIGQTRALAQGFNAAINMLASDREGNVLLNSYITDYFSNRNYRINTYSAPAKGTTINGSMDNAAFASACVEYVFGGNASEKTNQEKAYTYLQAIRLINNLYATLVGSPSFDDNNVYSVAAHLAWANYESIVDVELLSKYNVSVPFYKNQMILPIQSAGQVTSAFATHDMEKALKNLGYYHENKFVIPGTDLFTYKDSLAFALWFVPNSKKLLRAADLIQLEMRYREQHVENKSADFLMSEQNTYCRIKCIGKFSAVLPMISLESGDSVRGIEFQSVKYAGY